jgi:hypothetical protein
MTTRDLINNLSYEEFRKLWREFWFQKLGYHPSNKVGRVISVEQARKDDEELRKEFEKFYK